MHWMEGFGGGWMMLLWWGVVITAIIIIFKLLSSNRSTQNQKSAIEILKKRYAKGEISKE